VNRPFATAIAIAIGLVVLLGYFLPIPALTAIRIYLVEWGVILAGVAVLVGVFNLLLSHLSKLRKREKGWPYSLFLIAALLISVAVGILLGPDTPLMRGMFEAVILPVEKTLVALLAVTLIYASMRLLRRRAELITFLFLATAVLILMGTAALPGLGEIPILSDLVRPFVAQVLAGAGARGILLGAALGTLTTGLRILLGTDRPYGGR
jgi:nitrate reductase NapE component